MDTCVTEFSPEFKTRIENLEKSIFVGAVDEFGNIKEERCNLDKEFIRCRKYLDTLNRMQKLMILFYTRGYLSRVLNKYTRGLIIVSASISASSSREDIYRTIKNFIKYRNKFDVDPEDYYKSFFNHIIEWIKTKIEAVIISILEILHKNTVDDFPFNSDDSKILKKINSDYKKIQTEKDKYEYIIKLFFAQDEISDELLYSLLDLYFDEFNIKDFLDKLNEDMDIIINSAPPIDRCIRLFRSAGNYDKYKINQDIVSNTIISTSCSQKTNIGMFIDNCCIAEFIIKPGTHALFLNYEETAFGETMYEVILQKNLKFRVVKIEQKNIVKLEQHGMLEELDNPAFEIKKLVNINFEEPNVNSIKKNNVYLFEQIP